jgi:hypothetical protein
VFPRRFTAEVAALAGGINVIVLPPPCPLDVQPMDFGHAEALMTRAEADAGACLDGREVVVPRRRHTRRYQDSTPPGRRREGAAGERPPPGQTNTPNGSGRGGSRGSTALYLRSPRGSDSRVIERLDAA